MQNIHIITTWGDNDRAAQTHHHHLWVDRDSDSQHQHHEHTAQTHHCQRVVGSQHQQHKHAAQTHHCHLAADSDRITTKTMNMQCRLFIATWWRTVSINIVNVQQHGHIIIT